MNVDSFKALPWDLRELTNHLCVNSLKSISDWRGAFKKHTCGGSGGSIPTHRCCEALSIMHSVSQSVKTGRRPGDHQRETDPVWTPDLGHIKARVRWPLVWHISVSKCLAKHF